MAERAREAVHRLQARLVELEARGSAPIAVVGMACRLPGGIRTPDDYWSLLCRGEDAVTPIPAERWDTDAHFDPDPAARGRLYVRHGGFVDDIDRFDAALFDLSPREAEQLDPQQRMLLEETWAALEDSGDLSPRLAGSRTGVFVGMATLDYARRHLTSGDLSRIDSHSLTGAAAGIASGRIAYTFGLEGPAVTVDTACSSSLVAVHLAVQSLRDGSCDLAIAAGANAILDPALTVYLSRARALSPTGRCRAFDAAADGFVRSEGCAVVILRRLDDARARGDRVRAVVRGSAINNDGRSNGLTAPSGPAQERLLRDALRAARVLPEDVGYIEAHGTGTPLGDPIEYGALARVFGDRAAERPPLAIGSVKTNLGHLEAAAGIAGLMKVVLCLQEGTIPPQLHLRERNPHLGADEARIDIPTAMTPWPRGHARRVAGVSAFGFSGTNVHVVLEEAGPPPPPPAAVDRAAPDGAELAARGPALLALSAASAPALRQLAARFAARLEAEDPPELHDVCHSAGTGRMLLPVRAAIVASSRDQMARELARLADGQRGASAPRGRPRLAFLFTGQGQLAAEAGAALARSSPAFRAALDRLDRALLSMGEPSLHETLAADASAGAARVARRAQPALFAFQISLAAQWAAWGIAPHAVLGHSLGEYAAACVAGVCSAEDALRLVVERARLMDDLAPAGSMWAVQLDEASLRALIEAHPAVSLAAHNGPEDLVLSGSDDALGPAIAALRSTGARVRRLEVTHAFHSAQMDPVLAPLERAASRVPGQRARVSIYSTLLGRAAVPDELARPGYWRDHARMPVRFDAAMRAALADGVDAFVEIGPAPVLIALGRRIAGDGGALWLPSAQKGRAGIEPMLESLAALFERGAPFDAPGLAQERGGFTRVALPTYPFERQRHWMEPPPAVATAASSPGPARARAAEPSLKATAEPACGRPWFALDRLESPALEGAAFVTRLELSQLPLVADHRVLGGALVNLVVYLTLVSEAFQELTGSPCAELEDVVILRPLVLGEDERHDVQVLFRPGAEGAHFRVVSRRADDADRQSRPFTTHATGVARASAGSGFRLTGPGLPATDGAEPVDVDAFYAALARRGVELGPACRGVVALHRDGHRAVGRLRDGSCAAPGEPASIPLALIDAAFQATLLPGLALRADPAAPTPAPLSDETTRIMVGFRRLRRAGRWRDAVWVQAEEQRDEDGLASSFHLIDAAGETVAACEGIRQRPLPPGARLGQTAGARTEAPRPPSAPVSRQLDLAALSPTERAAAVERALVDLLAQVLHRSAGELAAGEMASLPLTQLGVDSLLAMEIIERIQRLTGVRVSLLSILQEATLARLAREVADRVGQPGSPELGAHAPESGSHARPAWPMEEGTI
ncbi:MAG TPA: beta-ketoacyl synthase N-terminal-like domain-containing protein [Kofleriaceae bacterium]|nr:beta-ketoacyl synthase N-terminal-like domain-containing protein [Kofleriaceae bacterium]